MEAAARFLAWDSIVSEKEILNLSPHQVRQAETQEDAANGAVNARIPEAYQWLIVPVQASPQAEIEWRRYRLQGHEALAERAGRRLRNDDLLVTKLAPTSLRIEMDRVPLWRGNHVSVRQLVDDFARYLYLPRLQDPRVLLGAISEGLSFITWETDSFAYADSYDDSAERYRGLRAAQIVSVTSDDRGLLVRPEVGAAT